MVDSMADDSETEQLIRSVEARPFLYDKKHEKYKKVYLKKKAWESIATGIASFEDASAAERRWNSLRGKYSTEMLRIKSGDLGLSSSKWKYFDSLSFLKEHVNPRTNINQGYIPVNYRQNTSNSWSPMNDLTAGLNNPETTATEQYYNNLLHLLSNNGEEGSLDNGNDFEEKKIKIDEAPQKKSNNDTPPKQKRTSSRIFGEYVGEALQEMGDDDSLEAQMKIMQVLMQYKKTQSG